jgi:hypothetical protein
MDIIASSAHYPETGNTFEPLVSIHSAEITELMLLLFYKNSSPRQSDYRMLKISLQLLENENKDSLTITQSLTTQTCCSIGLLGFGLLI